jgi:hypothetical protein
VSWRTARAAAAPLATVVWLLTVIGGMSVLWRYKNTPGAPAEAPTLWPERVAVERASGRPTLVMLAHPRCPCTRASLSELSRLMAQAEGAVQAHVLFLKPSDSEDGWEKTDLWRSAASIPGVRVAADVDGRQGGLFGATVSGQVVLYDARGRLLFRGGITGGRGHEGDNRGRSLVTSLIRSGGTGDRVEESRVFGCALVGRAPRG